MRRSISAFGALVAVCLVFPGCDRRSDGPASRTEITSVEIVGPSMPAQAPEGLGTFRESALGDLANLDERLHRLETRAGTRASSVEASRMLEDARRRRDALAARIEGLQAGTWERERDDVQRQWEEVSEVTERAGDLLADDAR